MTANATACQMFSIFIGIAEVVYMGAPVSNCDNCCPRNASLDIQYKLYTRSDSEFDHPLHSSTTETLKSSKKRKQAAAKKSSATVRSNPTTFRVIPTNDVAGLRASGFNFSKPTVIYLMGFSESSSGVSTTTLRNAFLTADDYNFIAVDWSRLIVFPWYITAVRNTRYMGLQLADFIQFLDQSGFPAASIHVVGFSLGAEAAGFAGKHLRSRGLLLGRISGLDPAYPGYSLTNNDGHLAKGDAAFVDVLHTSPVLGFPTAIGDVDFYANPGSYIQPGCWIDELYANKELAFLYGCSHVRAWRLYAESLTNRLGFPATSCRDWTSATRRCSFSWDGYMGIAATPPMAGKMYFLTNKKSPFSRNGP